MDDDSEISENYCDYRLFNKLDKSSSIGAEELKVDTSVR
jgi:hypothetical protein